MKIIIGAVFASTLTVGIANAADLYIPAESVPIYPTSAYDWGGFYVGINGGLAGGMFEHPISLDAEDDDDLINLATGSVDLTGYGFLYGVQAGFNVQMDNLLFGIEADLQGSTVEGRDYLTITDTQGLILPDAGDTFDADAGTSLDWLATLRPRIGWVNDRFVVYATGGLAYGQTTSSINADVDGDELFSESQTLDRWGYTIGGGVEYALTDNLTMKTEYLYTDLGSEEVVAGELGEGIFGSLDSQVSFHTVRAGLNFRF